MVLATLAQAHLNRTLAPSNLKNDTMSAKRGKGSFCLCDSPSLHFLSCLTCLFVALLPIFLARFALFVCFWAVGKDGNPTGVVL